MKILIDIDDVLNNLCETWCETLNERYGTTVGYQDVTEWDISKFFPELTKDQVFEPLHEPELWSRVKPKEGTVECVKKMIDDGHEVYLCTSTDYRNIQYKYVNFVQKYFPFIDWKHVIVIGKKQLIKADFLIDDYVNNLVGGLYVKLLMSAPHNLSYPAEKSEMFRVESLADAYDFIKAVERYTEKNLT